MATGSRLVLFHHEQAREVASWATSVAEALAWCSFDGHPVPDDEVAGWGGESGCEAYVLMDGSTAIAYGEVWLDDDGAEVELGRLIVAPPFRRRGFGLELTLALLATARGVSDVVYVRVRPDNDAAQRVYRRAGFRRVSPGLEQAWNEAQPVDYVWMQATEGHG